jgi:topoisomerase-4 subunit B
MDPDTRRLVQLVLDEGADTDSTFDLLLAKKRAGDRKHWLERKGDLADIAS